jgi:endo-1,4-beta-xylanase
MTEFDIGFDGATDSDKNTIMDEVLHIALSHPKIEGVIFWGFWDKAMWRKESALCTGDSFAVRLITNHLFIGERMLCS